MIRNATRGFTLIEIAFAMALLVVGLTAVTTVYMTALRWASETRQQYSAVAAAHQVLMAPGLLEGSRNGGDRLGYDVDSQLAKGWLNGYYVLRERLSRSAMPNTGAYHDEITVQVYAGGDDSDGELAHELQASVIVPGGN